MSSVKAGDNGRSDTGRRCKKTVGKRLSLFFQYNQVYSTWKKTGYSQMKTLVDRFAYMMASMIALHHANTMVVGQCLADAERVPRTWQRCRKQYQVSYL